MKYTVTTLLIFLPLFIFGQLNSHFLNVSYGFGKSNITKHTILNDRYSSIIANSLKLAYQVGLAERLSSNLGIALEQRGGQFNSLEREIIGETTPIVFGDTILRSNRNEFAYLTFSLKLNLKIYSDKKFKVLVGAGSYYSLLVKQLWVFDKSDIITLIEENILQFNYNAYDYGLNIDVGVDYSIFGNTLLFLNYSFQNGINDIFENEGIRGFHLRNSIDVGVKFSLKRQ